MKALVRKSYNPKILSRKFVISFETGGGRLLAFRNEKRITTFSEEKLDFSCLKQTNKIHCNKTKGNKHINVKRYRNGKTKKIKKYNQGNIYS